MRDIAFRAGLNLDSESLLRRVPIVVSVDSDKKDDRGKV